MSKEAMIFGYSGHAFVVLEILLLNGYEIKGYYDNNEKDFNPFKLTYLGKDTTVDRDKKSCAFIGIGNNNIRASVYQSLQEKEIICPVAIHKNATVSTSAILGSGTVVMAGTVINAMANIGNAVICNTSSIIEHECSIGDYAHIGPGAVLAGNVKVGQKSFIGANAVIKQGVTIGTGVTVGAGSVIVKDIADGTIVYGNPARYKKDG